MKSGRRTFRWVLFIVALIVSVTIIAYWQLLTYAIAQGKGQLNIIWNAEPVEEFLADPTFPDSLKQKLRLIGEVRKYAIDSLGLKDTDNYKTLYDQKGEEIMWVVTACEPYRLEPKVWSFPIVGTVPYKGFFKKARAVSLAQELDKEGWDVSVRNPGGWSTLGWFTDPILSKMLERSTGDLASLIIHEMAHATIFVKDSVDFNENLASFIGDRGAEQFLIDRYGAGSPEYNEFVFEDHDYVLFASHMLRGANYLDSLYQRVASYSEEDKKTAKDSAIAHIVRMADTLSFLSPKKPSERFRKSLPNNAYFMMYRHYQSGQEDLMREWKQSFDGDLRKYIRFLSDAYPYL